MSNLRGVVTLLGAGTLICTGIRKLMDISLTGGSKRGLAPLVKLSKEQRLLKEAMATEGKIGWDGEVIPWHMCLKPGERLYARMLPGKGHRWVVIAHGYGLDGNSMVYAARRFWDRGYNVLLPDLRAHGKSDGKYVGWGWLEREDIKGWCRCIREYDRESKIALYGVSMGAVAALCAVGEGAEVSCCISDCAFTSLKDIFYYRIRRMLHLSPKLVMLYLRPYCKRRIGIDVGGVSVVEQAARSRVPLMFCHGDRDRFVPTDSALELYAVTKAPKKLMLVHGAGHGVAALVGGEGYWNRVLDFADRYVG